MGVWDLLNRATDKVKQNAPDMRPVTKACRDSYSASASAVKNAYKIITTDEETQKKLFLKRIGTDIVVPELLRYTGIPGIIKAYSIYREVPLLSREETSQHQTQELKQIKEKYEKLHKEVQSLHYRNKVLSERIKGFESQSNRVHKNSEVVQTPEEVIIDFMMNGFRGRDLLGHLIVPGTGKQWKP